MNTFSKLGLVLIGLSLAAPGFAEGRLPVHTWEETDDPFLLVPPLLSPRAPLRLLVSDGLRAAFVLGLQAALVRCQGCVQVGGGRQPGDIGVEAFPEDLPCGHLGFQVQLQRFAVGFCIDGAVNLEPAAA